MPMTAAQRKAAAKKAAKKKAARKHGDGASSEIAKAVAKAIKDAVVEVVTEIQNKRRDTATDGSKTITNRFGRMATKKLSIPADSFRYDPTNLLQSCDVLCHGINLCCFFIHKSKPSLSDVTTGSLDTLELYTSVLNAIRAWYYGQTGRSMDQDEHGCRFLHLVEPALRNMILTVALVLQAFRGSTATDDDPFVDDDVAARAAIALSEPIAAYDFAFQETDIVRKMHGKQMAS